MDNLALDESKTNENSDDNVVPTISISLSSVIKDEEMETSMALELYDKKCPEEYIENLKQGFGDTEDFAKFEIYFYKLKEELSLSQSKAKELREELEKEQDSKRSLELMLLTENALRDQKIKNATTTCEKEKIQLEAEIKSMKCDLLTFKHSVELSSNEITLLREQLKQVEIEKHQLKSTIIGLNAQILEIDSFKSKCEIHLKREKEIAVGMNKQIEDVYMAKCALESLINAQKLEVDRFCIQMKNVRQKYTAALEKNKSYEATILELKSKAEFTTQRLKRSMERERELASTMQMMSVNGGSPIKLEKASSKSFNDSAHFLQHFNDTSDEKFKCLN